MTSKLESHQKILEDEGMSTDCSDNHIFVSEDKEEKLKK
jgi:hypothetical protein